MTLTELITRVKSFGYGSVDDGFITSWLNQAQEDVARRRLWTWLQDTVTLSTTANIKTTAIPSMSSWGRITPIVRGVIRPQEVRMMLLGDQPFRRVPDSGMPLYYAIWDGEVNWDPVPNAVYQYTLRYWVKVPALVLGSDVSILPTEDHDVLVQGALVRAADRDHNPGLIQSRKQEFEETISHMAGMDRMVAAEDRQRVRMPDSYDGVYDWKPFRRA